MFPIIILAVRSLFPDMAGPRPMDAPPPVMCFPCVEPPCDNSGVPAPPGCTDCAPPCQNNQAKKAKK